MQLGYRKGSFGVGGLDMTRQDTIDMITQPRNGPGSEFECITPNADALYLPECTSLTSCIPRNRQHHGSIQSPSTVLQSLPSSIPVKYLLSTYQASALMLSTHFFSAVRP